VLVNGAQTRYWWWASLFVISCW